MISIIESGFTEPVLTLIRGLCPPRADN